MSLKFIILLALLALACVLPEIESTSDSTKLNRKLCNKNVPKSHRESDMLNKLHLVTLRLMEKTVNEKLVKLKESTANTVNEEILESEERLAKLKKASDNLKKGKEIDKWGKLELAKLFLMKSTKLPPNEWGKLEEDKKDDFLEELRCYVEGLWKDDLKDNEWRRFLKELLPTTVEDEL